jgi:hypothetical protein
MGNIGYRLRNCLTLANLATLFFGVGLAMVGIFAPRVLENIPQETAVALFWAGIGAVIIGLIMIVLKYMRNPIEKKVKAFSIISVLERMYARLESLANKEAKKQVDWEKLVLVLGKITKLMQVTVPDVSSVDDAKKVIEDFEKGAASIFPADQKVQETMKQMVRISRLLERDGFGLRDRRRQDGKYNRLLRSVDKYYDDNKETIDEELRNLISIGVNFSECAANFLIYRDRLTVMLSQTPNFLTPSIEADIEGFKEDVREVTRRIRIKVAEKIKRLVEHNGNRN